ncbi:MAG: hypothetical protein ABIJ39_00185 [Chloroflexota bacterium]
MTFPTLIFGIFLSTAYGTAFHFWKGGELKRLILFVLLAWIGFWAGHIIGGLLEWQFAAIGPLNTGMATLGSALVLFVGNWLGQVEVVRE